MPRFKSKWREQMNRGNQTWEEEQKEKKAQKTLDEFEEENEHPHG